MSREVLMSYTWLAGTKFIPPHAPVDPVERGELLKQLYCGLLAYPFVLISAPTGSGKTSLLASLAKNYRELPVAWLSLDEKDNEPVQFMVALLKALDHLAPVSGNLTSTLLKRSSSIPEPHKIMGAFINDVIKKLNHSFVLVLDDFHCVTDPTIHLMLDFLLDRMPPQMHLVISTRHDPPLALSRLWARNKMMDLRLPQLRFTLEETLQFFNRHLTPGLTENELHSVYKYTEGWAAGLSIVANSMKIRDSKQAKNRLDFLAELFLNNRYLFEYLAEEVLSHLEPEVKNFLLQTSVLEELTPASCEAVSGQAKAGKLLKELYRQNLFIEIVDERGQVYRYHPLFAHFLRERLEDEMPEVLEKWHSQVSHVHLYQEPGVEPEISTDSTGEAEVECDQVAAARTILQPVTLPGSHERLSSREQEILRLIAFGATNREIASQLVISELTAKSHVNHILRKLDVTTRIKAVQRARQLGLLDITYNFNVSCNKVA